MANQRCLWSLVEQQRTAVHFEDADFVEHILCGGDEVRLIMRHFADHALMVVVGNAKEYPDGLHRLERLRTRQIRRRRSAGGEALPDQIGEKPPVVLASDLLLD